MKNIFSLINAQKSITSMKTLLSKICSYLCSKFYYFISRIFIEAILFLAILHWADYMVWDKNSHNTRKILTEPENDSRQ